MNAIPNYYRSREDATSRRRAIVLILVLIVIVMVSLAGFSFVATMSGENKAVHFRGEQLQMQYALASAEEFLKHQIVRPKPLAASGAADTNSSQQFKTSSIEDEALMRGVVVMDDESPNGRVRFTVMAPRFDESDSAKWSYGLGRESSRLDLHTIMAWESARPGTGRKALMQLPGMTESIADALLDWMDADRTARQSGAEDDYYATLNPPYSPRNTVPESIEELLLVKGVDRSLLFGDDKDQNHRLDWSERSSRSKSDRDANAENNWPWVELLTLYSGERNLMADGKPRINLNDLDLTRLHANVRSAFDANLATFVVLYRQYGPSITSPAQNGRAISTAANRVGPNPATSKAPATGPSATDDLAGITPNFTIPVRFVFRSPLDLIQAQIVMPAVAGKTGVVNSPLPFEQERSAQVLSDVCDRLTTTSDPLIRGRVNVNLAPAAVLRMIPSMDQTLADQIVAARTSAGGQKRNPNDHPCWPYVNGLVNLNQMKELLPYLTTGGDVYRAQIVAFSEASRLSQRVEVVLDASRPNVRRLMRKDLQVLGRGYPWDVLDTPAGIALSPTGASNATPARN